MSGHAFIVTAILVLGIGWCTVPLFKPETGVEAWYYVIRGIPFLVLLVWSIFWWKNIIVGTDLAWKPDTVKDINIYLWMGAVALWIACGFWGGPVLIWAVVASIWNCAYDRENEPAYVTNTFTSEKETMLQQD